MELTGVAGAMTDALTGATADALTAATPDALAAALGDALPGALTDAVILAAKSCSSPPPLYGSDLILGLPSVLRVTTQMRDGSSSSTVRFRRYLAG